MIKYITLSLSKRLNLKKCIQNKQVSIFHSIKPESGAASITSLLWYFVWSISCVSDHSPHLLICVQIYIQQYQSQIILWIFRLRKVCDVQYCPSLHSFEYSLNTMSFEAALALIKTQCVTNWIISFLRTCHWAVKCPFH